MKRRLIPFLTSLLVLTAAASFAACNPSGGDPSDNKQQGGEQLPNDGTDDEDKHTCKFDQQVAEEKYLYTQADCLHKATYYYSCSCGKSISESGYVKETFEYGDFGDHVLGELVKEVPATHFGNGCIAYQRCKICYKYFNSANEEIQSSDLTIPQIKHVFDQQVIDNKFLCTNATYTSPAKYYYSCECGTKGTETFEYGNPLTRRLSFKLNEGGESYSVTGIGSIIDADVVIPDEYEGKPVTRIERSAFQNNKTIKSISIPESVTEIGAYAFNSCAALTSVALNANITEISEYTFQKCKELTDITIPDSVTVIGKCAFIDCEKLSDLEIPDSVKAIRPAAFARCGAYRDVSNLYYIGDWLVGYIGDSQSLPSTVRILYGTKHIADEALAHAYSSVSISSYSTLIVPGSVIDIGTNAFRSIQFDTVSFEGNNLISIGDGAFSSSWFTSFSLPQSVKTIGSNAFDGCVKLKSITIPDSVTSLGDFAFSRCRELTTVSIGSGVAEMNGSVFSSCPKLTNVSVSSANKNYSVAPIGSIFSKDVKTLVWSNSDTIPASVEHIDDYAFYNSQKIRRLTVPTSVTTIGKYAFGNSTLSEITIPETVKEIGERAFNGCTNLTEIAIPNGITVIQDETFNACRLLAKITLPEGLTDIGKGAFSGCAALESIALPESLKSIGKSAFSGCSSLKEVVLPDGVTSIGGFSGCTALESIVIPEGVTEIDEYAFYKCESLRTITIPASLKKIGGHAFEYCSSLTVIYDGTEEQWKKISFGTNNNPLFNAEKIFKS